ncbi:LysE family translocator [Flexibacterium corallicola]|uniref:LysE family translocator n=1 Tax=Flexibacterium corallicola TaxID=3037259 RepID=UPI00286F4364|nr:LysE family translocator [Pseudovibrio sp. M1P-2-3]
MSFELWSAFALASIIELVAPGPILIVVTSFPLRYGYGAAFPSVVGAVLGNALAMTASLFAIHMFILSSDRLFEILQIVGAIVLVWLGYKMWRARPVSTAGLNTPHKPMSYLGIFSSTLLISIAAPNTLMFYTSFTPQFLNKSGNIMLQILILEATYIILSIIIYSAWALLSGKFSEVLRSPTALRVANRIGAFCLIVMGVIAISVQA